MDFFQWELANKYGDGCASYIGKSSMAVSGNIVEVQVMHRLVPPAINKLNNKEASQIIFLEEFDINKNMVRFRRITFYYDDGEIGAPMEMMSKWAPVEKGTLKELNCIKGLLPSKKWWHF